MVDRIRIFLVRKHRKLLQEEHVPVQLVLSHTAAMFIALAMFVHLAACYQKVAKWWLKAQGQYQWVVGWPGAVDSQRCTEEPSNSTSNQQAIPCTTQGLPAAHISYSMCQLFLQISFVPGKDLAVQI